MERTLALASLVFASLCTAASAKADAATAELLFREGRRLLDEGDLEHACEKLAESQAQEASSGTLINLALCHEKQDKLATAWAEYIAAARLANAQKRADRAETANLKTTELEPRLGRLVIRADATPGLVVLRGSERVGAGAYGTAVPVDAGNYTLDATAPGYQRWTAEVTVADGKTTELRIPPLERDLTTAPSKPAEIPLITAPQPPPEAARSTLPGWIAGGGGVVALGLGTGFGIAALSSYASADEACKSHVNCSDASLAARDRATTQAWVANIGIGAGIAALAFATYWLITHK